MTTNGETPQQNPEDSNTAATSDVLRLQVLGIGKAIIQGIQAGDEFGGLGTAAFPGEEGSTRGSVVIGTMTDKDLWEGRPRSLAMIRAMSCMLTLDGDRLDVAIFSRRPNTTGMETIAIHSTVTPGEDLHSEEYDSFIAGNTVFPRNHSQPSPRQPYDIQSLYDDLTDLNGQRGVASAEESGSRRSFIRRFFRRSSDS